MPEVLEFRHFYTEKIAINIYESTQIINSIKFSIQIQFGVFLRGHFGTPNDTAPVLLSGILCSTSHVCQAEKVSRTVARLSEGLSAELSFPTRAKRESRRS